MLHSYLLFLGVFSIFIDLLAFLDFFVFLVTGSSSTSDDGLPVFSLDGANVVDGFQDGCVVGVSVGL